MILNNLGKLAVATLITLMASFAQADVSSVLSSENNVYEVEGGNSGQPFFFNAQSTEPMGGDDFREFGVQDFDGSAFFSGEVTSINSVNFLINDSAAFFAAAGEVAFYLAEDNTGALTDDRAFYLPTEAPNGVGGQFGMLTSLGTGAYVPEEDVLDDFSLTLDVAAEAQLIDLLNNGENIRLIVAGNDDTIAATWDGLTGFAYPINGIDGPTLAIDAEVIPEPTIVPLVLASVVGMLGRRRR